MRKNSFLTSNRIEVIIPFLSKTVLRRKVLKIKPRSWQCKAVLRKSYKGKTRNGSNTHGKNLIREEVDDRRVEGQ